MQVKLRCEYFCDDSTKDCDIGAEYAIAKSTSGYPGVRIFFYCCWHKKEFERDTCYDDSDNDIRWLLEEDE